MLRGVTLARMNNTASDDLSKIGLDQALEHLKTILESPSFSTSKRCQDFLRYIVMEAASGRGDQINERTIAYEVFGKSASFEPGEDSLVRVKARDVRKRLSEYYDATPDSPIRIEIPLGGYSPRVQISGDSAVADSFQKDIDERAAKSVGRRRFVCMLGGSIGIVGIAAIVPLVRRQSTPLDSLWRPIFATKTPLLIFIPVLTDRTTGELDDRIGIGPAAALGRAADFLTKQNYPYRLRFGVDLTFSQMREQPSLLLGGFSSEWTSRMTRDLRFTLVSNSEGGQIVDTKTKQTWKSVHPRPNGYADQDYGILCRLFDAESGQIVLLAAGLTTFATEGAANVFFDPTLFSELVKHAPPNWEAMQFEAVIRVSIIGTTPSSPQFVAIYFW